MTYAERAFGLASKSRTRGDGGLFLDEYYRFTLSFAAARPRGYITAGGLARGPGMEKWLLMFKSMRETRLIERRGMGKKKKKKHRPTLF